MASLEVGYEDVEKIFLRRFMHLLIDVAVLFIVRSVSPSQGLSAAFRGLNLKRGQPCRSSIQRIAFKKDILGGYGIDLPVAICLPE